MHKYRIQLKLGRNSRYKIPVCVSLDDRWASKPIDGQADSWVLSANLSLARFGTVHLAI